VLDCSCCGYLQAIAMKILSLLHYDCCFDFNMSRRFIVQLEMLITSDGVYGLKSFCNDEIEVNVKNICTQ